jgi:hypothetical protein
MTKSIQTDNNGRVETIFNGEKSGDGWVQIPDSDFPSVSEDNVSKTYWYDSDSVTVETEPIPDDDLI